MSSNSFGTIFRITTWGESHGKAIGVVIDGCPAGLALSSEEIDCDLARRAPGNSPYTSPRKESDRCEILSGLFEGKTTGAPLAILIPNRDVDTSKYAPMKDQLRPGHANFTYLGKYGLHDWGGGRSSARETAARVAAGAVARKFLSHYGIKVCAYVKQISHVMAECDTANLVGMRKKSQESPVFCPCPEASSQMMTAIEEAMQQGDSLGGIVEFVATGLPVGLGDPIYGKLEAVLASAMMSLPASKGFEIGSGFDSVTMKGSESNDLFVKTEGRIETTSNFAGGTLGGISTGMPLIGRVAFKPTSSIRKPQETLDLNGERTTLELPPGSRHDPCVAPRASPVVEAMVLLVLADALLINRSAKL